ncbi:MAG: DUF1553 domain-containing protein [Spirosomataceae bacterium]
MKTKWLSVLVATVTLAVGYQSLHYWNSDRIDFNTQVKPLLNRKCIACHGGVKRAGEFSLLFRQDAVGTKGKSGKIAIVPGDASHSEVIRRITSHDPEERMPKKEEPLSSAEIELLTNWIDQGAEWGDHWAYTPLHEVKVPKSGLLAGFFDWIWGNKASEWAKNDVDFFVWDKLQANGLKPSVEAEKATLLRRVSLDLTGLPPSHDLLQRFLKDNRPNAYEIVVDSLLASPQYGERWAGMWLDIARYSDTKGYERDDSRSIWKYRDWLIKAFNEDKPYNQFIVEQLAGDLLPNPTDDQLIATAFHRNTMTNDEGGTDNEEFRTAAVIDRVNTTWETLQSTTFACVQCHSHPYDPFRHEEYYKYLAFFNNSRDEDSYGDYPLLRTFSETQQAKLDSLTNWIRQESSVQHAQEVKKFLKMWHPAYNSLVCDKFVKSELIDTKWLGVQNGGSARLARVNLTGKTQLLYRYQSNKPGGTLLIRLDSLNGKVLQQTKIDTTGRKGWQFVLLDIPVVSGVHDVYFTALNPKLKGAEDYTIQFDWMTFGATYVPGKGKPGYAVAQKQFWDLMYQSPEVVTPIMLENPADMFRKTQVFERGNWLAKGKNVSPNVPASLGGLPKGYAPNRLGLAQWMTSRQQPLTARTAVNRFWEQLFGTGLVETLEDFGTQGLSPTHLGLLDYLSLQFATEYKWSMKRLLKTMVMSATYRQDSKASPELLEKDPSNRWLARGPRVRLSAEQVRDQALSISGLLSTKMYGKSVMPYQPDGVWQSPYNGRSWEQNYDEDGYRRALYTYWKRTSPYPSLLMFDGASREVCLARRIRSNTPLQALVTLNDPAFLEAGKQLALRMEAEAKGTPETQLRYGYQLAMAHDINPAKLAILKRLYEQNLANFRKHPDQAMALLNICPDDDKRYWPKDIPARATLLTVANTLMNLDEFITKE